MTASAVSAEELRQENEKRLRQIVERTGKSPEALYEEREARIRAAVELRVPDRVPVVLGGTYFAARYSGLSLASAYYDAPTWKEAFKRMILDFEPDATGTGGAMSSGLVQEILGARQMRWPGGTLPPDVGHQFVEGEYMKEDEYDLFLEDPSDFIIRRYLPRVYDALAPLAQLPSPSIWLGSGAFAASVPIFAAAEFQQLFETLVRAGQEEERWRQTAHGLEEEVAALGFPASAHGMGAGGAPFDVVSDSLRGMRGSMLDMYRRPEKLLAACDKILSWRLARTPPPDPERRGNPKIAATALHRGSQGFMSKKQFETFYWPGLKSAILASIELGYVAEPFFEGRWDDRLEYLLEIPAGKMICRFSETDMAKAKAVLGDSFCLMGNVPASLLQAGSPSEVEEYCRKLIAVCGKGGGFILRSSTDSLDEAKPANVRAMVESAKKYGLY